jgi:predicted TPR repeat methyltransferase
MWQGFRKVAPNLPIISPDGIQTLLDLGCGTDLELEEIFRHNSDVHVTGIDLTQAMHHYCVGMYAIIYF